MAQCVQYVNQQYEWRDELQNAVDFCVHDLMDAPSGDVVSLAKVGFFPWVEAARELDQSLSLILLAHYKHAYDSFRRAIELVVTGAFFVSDSSDHVKARKWMDSERGTPNFKRACDALADLPIFKELNLDHGWADAILGLYWKLSDVVHVKGEANSYNEICPIYSTINGIGEPAFSEKACKLALDSYIETIRHIAVVVAASNPRLLQGLDLDSKFGLNPPASGFFYPSQAERLLSLVPIQFRSYLKHIRDTDEDIKGIREWFESLPDITEDELRVQARHMGFDLDEHNQ